MAQGRSQWCVGGASVIGAAHVRRGQVNQDAVAWTPARATQWTERFAVAVSDGHGGRAYVRSDVGSQHAVQAALTALEWAVDEPEQLGQLPGDVVDIWRQSVGEHAAAQPLADPPRGDLFTAYGATLIAVGVTPTRLVALQIGDGDLLLGYPDGSIRRPLADDQGLVGEQTYSLCLADAARYMRLQVFEYDTASAWPDFVLLATDGVSKSFVDEAAFLGVAEHYRSLCSAGAEPFRATVAALPEWLREVSERGSGDDASLCLASRFYEL